jgi:hypothetical protein
MLDAVARDPHYAIVSTVQRLPPQNVTIDCTPPRRCQTPVNGVSHEHVICGIRNVH